MSSQDYDYLMKFIIIGESGTGKTSILHHFLENRTKKNPNPTVGVEFGCKFLQIGEKVIKLQIWDTAGQERYRSVTRSYYRGAAAALIVYDITNPESFVKLFSWINDAKSFAKHNISMLIIGNKCDLEDARAVEFIDAANFSQENNIQILETSAITGDNIELAFGKLAKTVLDRMKSGENQSFKGIQAGRVSVRDRSCNC